MSYGTFKSVGEVAKIFDIEVVNRTSFVNKKTLEVSDILLSMIEEELHDDTNYVSEYAICEAIIRPILKTVAKNYSLKVWSHVSYDVDKEKGLVGKPDYLIAARTKYGTMARPSLCVIEAKQDNFEEGWAQALAEMVASSLLGTTICYGIVSTGEFWQFGKLENNVFVIDSISTSAIADLQNVLNIINWLFYEISSENIVK
jgi:hypothetical protein